MQDKKTFLLITTEFYYNNLIIINLEWKNRKILHYICVITFFKSNLFNFLNIENFLINYLISKSQPYVSQNYFNRNIHSVTCLFPNFRTDNAGY